MACAHADFDSLFICSVVSVRVLIKIRTLIGQMNHYIIHQSVYSELTVGLCVIVNIDIEIDLKSYDSISCVRLRIF